MEVMRQTRKSLKKGDNKFSESPLDSRKLYNEKNHQSPSSFKWNIHQYYEAASYMTKEEFAKA
jgi:hypothetical protein